MSFIQVSKPCSLGLHEAHNFQELYYLGSSRNLLSFVTIFQSLKGFRRDYQGLSPEKIVCPDMFHLAQKVNNSSTQTLSPFISSRRLDQTECPHNTVDL